MEFLKAYISHRAKAFAAALAPAVTTAILESIEKAFDVAIGVETKAIIVSAVTSQFVYWVANGPKEGA